MGLEQHMRSCELKKFVREIPDFPIPGILFRDITTVLKDPAALKGSIDAMVNLLGDLDYDSILGPESRGFIFGMPMAYKLGKGFVPVRKAGKLPAEIARREYALEYGTAAIEIHRDAVVPGQRYIIADDLLATGGTAKAIADLVTELGGIIVSSLFFIELERLGGREMLAGYDVRSVLSYD